MLFSNPRTVKGRCWFSDGCLSHSPASGMRTSLAWQEALSLKEWFSWDLWSGSAFPRESTAANLGKVNKVLKANYMAETWLWRPVRPVLVEILNMGKKCGYISEMFCIVNPQNLLKPVGGTFSRILGNIAFIFSKLQHVSNKVLYGILLQMRRWQVSAPVLLTWQMLLLKPKLRGSVLQPWHVVHWPWRFFASWTSISLPAL